MVSRDPFGRTELHRESVKPAKHEGCKWCGNVNGYATLFEYRNESDGGRTYQISGRFCSVSCMRAYHCD